MIAGLGESDLGEGVVAEYGKGDEEEVWLPDEGKMSIRPRPEAFGSAERESIRSATSLAEV